MARRARELRDERFATLAIATSAGACDLIDARAAVATFARLSWAATTSRPLAHSLALTTRQESGRFAGPLLLSADSSHAAVVVTAGGRTDRIESSVRRNTGSRKRRAAREEGIGTQATPARSSHDFDVAGTAVRCCCRTSWVVLFRGAVGDLECGDRRRHAVPRSRASSWASLWPQAGARGIIGGRRWWTVSTISRVSIPWR
jgi:hypothetical protein